MKTRTTLIPMSLLIGSLCLNGIACAHGPGKHDKMVPADAPMKKLHTMMPVFSLASAAMETALEKGELSVLESEAKKITSAIPDLKKTQPHKNIKQRGKYVEHASYLEECVVTTVAQAKKGSLTEAKAAFEKVEEACAACHAKFRD